MKSLQLSSDNNSGDCQDCETFIGRRKPTLLPHTDLGKTLASIKTYEDFFDSFGHVNIPTTDQYYYAIGIAQVQASIREHLESNNNLDNKLRSPIKKDNMLLSEYDEYVRKYYDPACYHLSFSPPKELLETIVVPDFCKASKEEVDTVKYRCLIGKKGYFSQLHFDKDAYHGLLYNVYGRKSVIYIPPSASKKLEPFTQFSGLCLQNFSDKELTEFLAYVGGSKITLNPGDCAYIPPLYWHYVYYLDDCFSINIRFCQSKKLEVMENLFFPDVYFQGICCAILDGRISDSNYTALLSELQQHSTGSNRERLPQHVSRDLFNRYTKEPDPLKYSLDFEEFFPSPLADLMYRKEQ